VKCPKSTSYGEEEMTAPKIIVSEIAQVNPKTLVPYRKNPRIGDVNGIAESLKVNGQFRPVVVNRGDKATVQDEILAGNHTVKGALKLGWTKVSVSYVNVDDDAAKLIVLADNRLNDVASYEPVNLAELLANIPEVTGTGYSTADVQSILAGIEEKNSEMIEEVVRPAIAKVDFTEAPDGETLAAKRQERYDENLGRKFRRKSTEEEDDDKLTITPEDQVNLNIASIQRDLESVKNMLFPVDNYWGIPHLRTDRLVDSIPDPIKTWGGAEATPDDGVTTYLWNFGLASSKGLPWDRTMMCAFTYDTKFQSLYDEPAWQFARLIHNGLKQAIVPDFSFWVEEPRFFHLQAAYRAQWVGRLMQELEIRVMPRLMFCDPESINYGKFGVPLNAPVVAICIQAATAEEFRRGLTAEGLRQFVREVKPQALLVYGGNPAKEVVADAKLPTSLHVQHVDNYAAVRRGTVFDKKQGLKSKVGKKMAKQDGDVFDDTHEAEDEVSVNEVEVEVQAEE
jgi:ParB-like chromosome segregation protein Spo0J